jgi:type I restriction enzyme S subunit
VTYFWEYDRAPERLVGGFFTREGLQRLAALRCQCPIHPTCPTTPNTETPPLTVMHRWPTGRLGEVADVSKERIEPSAYPSENFHYIGLEPIEPHTGRLLAVEKTLGAEILSTKNVFRSGLLYGKLRPYLNKVHLAQTNGICSTDIFVLDTKPTRARPAFVAYFLRSAHVLRRVAELMEGANLPRINRDDLLSLPVPLPPLSEQERIVAILDEAEGLRQRRAEADRRTAELLPALFHQMFGDPATNPKRWPIVKLGEITTLVTSGFTPKGGEQVYTESGPYFIRSQNVLMNRLDLSNAAYLPAAVYASMSRTSVHDGGVLLNITGASIGRVTWV